MKSQPVHLGIDVSKHSLELSPFDRGMPVVRNSVTGINQLIKRIRKSRHRIVVCCEATGSYEKLLCAMLLNAGIEVACANPARVRYFALSKGILAKTDPIDAKTLAGYSAERTPRLLKQLPSWQSEVSGLLKRRTDLKQIKTSESSRLDPVPHPESARLISRHIKQLERYITEIETKLCELIAAHAELKAKVSRLMEVKSFGQITALSLIAYLPELGHISGKQASALAGLAPYARDSGTHSGRRSIRAGRSNIRKALYMPAVCARSHNPVLKAYHRNLIDQGKPEKVALTALMRKMVVLANRILSDPDFNISA